MDEYTLDDISPWISMFPLDQVPSSQQFGIQITSPRHLALIEQLRARATTMYDLGPHVPVDVFVFAQGEPDRRDVTKVGGRPYRPADKPWPLTRRGKPMTFLAQYRFVESRDLTGDLPGDVLLVFVRDEEFWADPEDYPEACVFEWYPLGLNNLIDEKDLPEPDWEFHTCYGIRHRTVDYIDEGLPELIVNCLPDEHVQFPLRTRPICRIKGMKIGGAPFWLEPENIELDVDLPGKFLCALSGIHADPFGAYPWMNHPEPLSEQEGDSNIGKALDIMEGFVLNVSISDSAQIHWCLDLGG